MQRRIRKSGGARPAPAQELNHRKDETNQSAGAAGYNTIHNSYLFASHFYRDGGKGAITTRPEGDNSNSCNMYLTGDGGLTDPPCRIPS